MNDLNKMPTYGEGYDAGLRDAKIKAHQKGKTMKLTIELTKEEIEHISNIESATSIEAKLAYAIDMAEIGEEIETQ